MASWGDLERFVEQHQDLCDAGHPASNDLINEAEQFLQITFPSEYREFLGRWGSLSIGPMEFYGITGRDFESSSIPNGIWFTYSKRQHLSLPKNLVILCDNNGDEYYCLDTAQFDKSRIVSWGTSSRKVLTVKSESLLDFILNEAEEFVN